MPQADRIFAVLTPRQPLKNQQISTIFERQGSVTQSGVSSRANIDVRKDAGIPLPERPHGPAWRAAALATSLALTVSAGHAQTPPTEMPPMRICNFEQLDTDRGLSSNTVNVVYCDAMGLMWIGTEDGLNTFDGYTIRSFKPNHNDTTSIDGKQVLGIGEFNPNKITVALGDGGINIYNKRTGIFSRNRQEDFMQPRDVQSSFGLCGVGDDIYAVFPECVIKRNRLTGRIRRIDLPKKMPQSGIRWGRMKMTLMPGGDGRVAIHTGTKSVSMMDTRYENIVEEKFDNLFIYSIAPLDDSRLALATRTGLFSYDFRAKELTPTPILQGELVQAVTRNDDGDLWVAYAGNKLLKWSPSQNKIVRVENSRRFLNKQTRVNDLFEDENGLLWVATSNSGLIKLDTKKLKITTKFIDVDMPLDHLTNDISASDANTIWAACGTNGLVRVDLASRTSTVIDVPHQNVKSVLARANGTILLGTTRRLMRYTPATGCMESIEIHEHTADSAGRVMIRNINEDCLGNIWLSTQLGLYRFNGVNFELMQSDKGGNFVFNSAMEDSDGRIWAGSCSGALVRDASGGPFRRIGKQWTGRNDEGVLCIAEHKGRIFMGSSDGVMVFDKRTCEEADNSIFATFANKMIYSIVCDANGIVWLNTSSGVGYVDLNYSNVYTFGNSDGLYNEGNECHKFTVAKDMIYFGQVTAINAIDTRHISFNTRMPKTFVSEVVYGQSGLEETMKMRDDTTFSHKYLANASTKIRLASSDYSVPSRNLFMYKLDDNEWVQLGNSNEILLSGIMPGTYRIRLRSSNADKTWSYDVKTVYIYIESPLWLSRPAMIFYAIWLMSIIWLFLNLRFRNINKRMKLAEAEAKSKSIVEDQRNKLAVAVNEQRASFNYAKRIQDALMPEVKSVEKKFIKFFVLYRPKDIVSGDFYTFYHRDGMSFVVSADCTGHGVPGAFISILGIDHISNIIMQQKVDDAGEILTHLQAELREAVSKIGSDEFNDGMDITICVVHHAEMRINFAGAMNDLYIIRNNEVLEFHGERKSIGTDLTMDNSRPATVFHSRDIECQPGDMMYMFSDGYCDQFGGPEQKKFKVRRFKNLLLNIHKLPANDQKMLLNQKLVEWMGGCEQTDDISVIGFEPWA